VLASGWDRASPLIDPLCGSGTIAIEAALLAAGRPPGVGRRFAFEDWPSFQPGTWASVTGSAGAAGAAGAAGSAAAGAAGSAGAAASPGPIFARDRDAGAVRAARANAARAGVSDLIDIDRASVSELAAPPGDHGWLVSNPPYGKRVAGGDLRDLYARLGDVARTRLPGWTVALLVAEERMAAQTGLVLEERLRTENGGIPVRVLVGPASARPARSGRAARSARRVAGSARRAAGSAGPAGSAGRAAGSAGSAGSAARIQGRRSTREKGGS
jgi:putative N6-adenine-specific DNA methylase